MADPAPDDGADVAPALFTRLAADPLAELLGIRLEQVRPGYARAAMTVGPQQLNSVGTAHGGATMALLDVVHSAVSNSHGTVAVAQDVHTEFLSAGRPGDQLVAEGVEVHRSSRTAGLGVGRRPGGPGRRRGPGRADQPGAHRRRRPGRAAAGDGQRADRVAD